MDLGVYIHVYLLYTKHTCIDLLVKYQIFDMFVTNIPCTELVNWAQNTKGAQDLKAPSTEVPRF
jgi:hypothetical protein